MAKTVALSEETHNILEELKKMLQKQLPIKVNQKEAVAIAISESYKKRKKVKKIK